MSSQKPKTSKPQNQQQSFNQTPSQPPLSRSSPSSHSSHFAMIEFKQRILTSLSKLSDRDTHQIAVDDLEKIIQTLTPEGIPLLLNCLYNATNDPKPAVKKESLRLLASVCASHSESTSAHLTKIIAHIVCTLKDSDSGVKDACRDVIGSLSCLCFNVEGENGGFGSTVAMFVKPLFEAMSEQNKSVQSGAAMCMCKMVECATNPPVVAFQKLCPRVYKLLSNPNFLAKAALLPVVSSLSQVGALAPQSMEPLFQNIHELLDCPDWATRKAAADALSALALHSSTLVVDRATSTLTALEACRFDKIKPVRDSMTEALNLWKKVAGKEDPSSDEENSEPAEPLKNVLGEKKMNNSNGSSPTTNSVAKTKGGSIFDKAGGMLKKKTPALTDKEPNPEFFLKLETRGSDDLPVEVVVPRRYQNSSSSHTEKESAQNGIDLRKPNRAGNYQPDDANSSLNIKHHSMVRETVGFLSRQRDTDNLTQEDIWAKEKAYEKDSRKRPGDAEDRMDLNQRESSGLRAGISRNDGQSEGSAASNKGNWLAIQRQLLLLERQQAHLMNMLQIFMGGSHDNLLKLENRVRGLERVVEDMACDLSISSVRRGGNFKVEYEGSSNRHISKFHGFSDYSDSKYGRGGDVRNPFGERLAPSEGMRGRVRPWRSDIPEAWDRHSYSTIRTGQMGSRRGVGGGSMEVRSPKSDHESDAVSGRRDWDKGSGPLRLGEGPSARSVWQASKDEATLEAIRVAGDDNGSAHTSRVAIPELTAEAMGDDNAAQERDPVWNSWSNAMDALHVGDMDLAFAEVFSTGDDMDLAFAEVFSTGDDMLLVKLMDRTGPVIDQLSNETSIEALNAVGQFVLEQNLIDICLAWIQQLVDIVMENGDVLGIPMEVRKEILLNLHVASSTMDPPEDWEGASPDELLLQLASAWGIDTQQFDK